MPTIFQDAGLIGTAIPLSVLGALLLLISYRGLREPFVRSWMIFEFLEAFFLSGIFVLLFDDSLSKAQHVIGTGTATVFLVGGLGPLFLFQGFLEAVGRPISLRARICIYVSFVCSGVILGNAVLGGGRVQFLGLSMFGDLAMATAALYIAIVGFSDKATRVLAIGGGLKFLSLVPKLLLSAAVVSSNFAAISRPNPPASAYTWVLLIQSAISGLIVFGLIYA